MKIEMKIKFRGRKFKVKEEISEELIPHDWAWDSCFLRTHAEEMSRQLVKGLLDQWKVGDRV